MTKLKLLLFLLLLGVSFTIFGQAVTIKNLEVGPYGQGSSIAVSISIDDVNGNLKTNNVFKLFISDDTGNFENAIEIGSYPGFYTTFVNGIIPNNLPAGDYKVLVKFANDELISNASNTFKVIAKSGVKADIEANAIQTIHDNPKTFGVCKPEKSTNFRFTNSSSAGAVVSLNVINEISLATQNFDFNTAQVVINADMAHYTIFAKAELNGIIGTKAFFLINNAIKPGFNAPANNTLCLPAELLYDIETKSINGIQNNFPGYSYKVNWGDGNIEDFTPNKIIATGAQIKHTYTKSSCGNQIRINAVDYYNVYGIIYQVNSPFCGLVSVPISTQAKLLTKPENEFGLPAIVCVNTPFTITNKSIAGDNPSSTAPECANNNNVYYWFVDGVNATPQGVPLSYDFKPVFTTQGYHTVRLESESFSSCEALPIEKTCFVQLTPTPAFSLSETQTCAGTIIKATNESVIDLSEKAQNIYKWEFRGPYIVDFANGTNNASKNPEFIFNKEGVFDIRLSILTPCGEIFVEKTVIINEKPTIIANWQTSLCGKGQVLSFDESTGNTMKTVFTGTAKTEVDTYKWEISGGAFSFKNGTHANSKFPSILFEDYATYTIVTTHQNNCGTETMSKTIVFNEAPTVSAGVDQTVCNTAEVALEGSINGAFTGVSWIGGEGVFTPSRNVLNPIYKPSSAETLTGQVSLVFSVKANSAAPCDIIEDVMLIKIKPANKITSAANKNVCSGTMVNYSPKATLAGTTFSWIASGKDNVSGFSESGEGDIKDVLINSQSDNEASVSYLITPINEGCKGETFEFIVTVTALPKVTAIASSPTICSGKESVIILSTNTTNLRYTWTSTATGKITGNSQKTTPTALTEIAEVLTNNGDSTGTVTYTIIPENITGCTSSPMIIIVKVSAATGFATFSPDKTTGCSPLKIAFKNTTPGAANKYYWDFGDGKTLITTDNNTVNHIYISSITKTYTAKLVTETDCGSFTSEYIIRVSPNTIQPFLVVNGNEYEGCAPHTVKFNNNTKGALLYKYDFGDGTIIETNKSPEIISHTFKQGGTYVVKLTASNGCSDTTITQTIKVYPAAISDFVADVAVACDSVIVKFNNKSIGAIAYLWDFGDGTVSTDENPVHQFGNTKAAYTVTLISYSSFGCATTSEKVDYIKLGIAPKADFTVSPGLTIQYPNYRFEFKNKTAGTANTYTWDFGDGTTSSLTDPIHSYADTGSYKVNLLVTNQSGCSSMFSQTVRIIGTPGNLFIPNAFMPNSLTNEIRTFQAKGSGMAEWHLRIFNKWGQMVWETHLLDDKGRPTEGWDGMMFGQPAPQGIYFWDVAAKFINGTEWAGMVFSEGTNPKKAGTLNLIR
ncbi:PKD domain-containing protein [Pedobacter alpinus]|uniref:PKD domain-containing protein n=1 Tax=Pedobacter alpinus TaxID=1590643 RepID=A0ABW5TP33_9SPHI